MNGLGKCKSHWIFGRRIQFFHTLIFRQILSFSIYSPLFYVIFFFRFFGFFFILSFFATRNEYFFFQEVLNIVTMFVG